MNRADGTKLRFILQIEPERSEGHQPCSAALRSVPSSAPSMGLIVNQNSSRQSGRFVAVLYQPLVRRTPAHHNSLRALGYTTQAASFKRVAAGATRQSGSNSRKFGSPHTSSASSKRFSPVAGQQQGSSVSGTYSANSVSLFAGARPPRRSPGHSIGSPRPFRTAARAR